MPRCFPTLAPLSLQRTTGLLEQRAADGAPSAMDAAVAEAQALMREHVDEPLSCREIARRVGLSLRQMERRFRDVLQCSVL
jgi:transcriptional regulator GlxA family with amidase domain